jgi:hypothetical protein
MSCSGRLTRYQLGMDMQMGGFAETASVLVDDDA